MINIGIIGHPMISEVMEKIIHKYFKNIKTTKIDFIHINQVLTIVQYLQSQQDFFDGYIFTGKIPFDIVNHRMYSKNPWVYFEQNQSLLQRMLLKAKLTTEYDPLNVSIDSYEKDIIINTYEEIGLEEKDYKFYIPDLDIFDKYFFDKLIKFHRENYIKNGVSFCITGISQVYEQLTKESIPCMLLTPTTELVKQILTHLLLKLRSKENEKSRIVVLSIEIDLLNEYSIFNENEYEIMTEKTKVTEKVYLFAQRIQATVIEIGRRGYLLFSTKNILEYETKNLQKISLLNDIARSTKRTISIGIGYGITSREANFSASQGMNRAKKRGGNQCFVVNDGTFIGPIYPDSNADENDTKIDKTFNIISENTGVSVRTIFKIYSFINQKSSNCFIPKELANYLDISLRSMNRLLVKFEDAGYMKVVGKKLVEGVGRPSRIVELKF